MSEFCKCGTGGDNTGLPNCISQLSQETSFILVQTIADDGTRNKISKSDFTNGKLSAQFVTDKINNPDKSKRWYPTPKINNVTDARAEAVTFDVDGIPKIVKQGARTFAGSFYGGASNPKFAAVLNSFKCKTMSYYPIGKDGSIIGNENGEDLFPTDIEEGTWIAGVVKTSTSEPASVSLAFAVNELVRDENMRQINASQIDIDMNLVTGLRDVVGEALSTPTITTTTVRVDLNYIYGAFNDKQPFKGVVVADFSPDGGTTDSTVYNVTQSSNVTLTSATEVADGLYDLVLSAAQTSADVIRVQIAKEGFEMVAFEYTIP